MSAASRSCAFAAAMHPAAPARGKPTAHSARHTVSQLSAKRSLVVVSHGGLLNRIGDGVQPLKTFLTATFNGFRSEQVSHRIASQRIAAQRIAAAVPRVSAL